MVGLLDDSFKIIPIGSRIRVNGDCGTVKYVGEVKGYIGTWIGVEWDDKTRGKHDGLFEGVRYFRTKHPTGGSMIRQAKLSKFETLEGAIIERYLLNTDNLVDEELLKETQNFLGASLFEIVGIEKLAKKQSCIEKLTDISVANSSVISAGNLDLLKNLTSLNVSSTLIWNWNIVADITQQLQSLKFLDLSSNRLVLPSDNDIKVLAPHFTNLKFLNLGKCDLHNWEDILYIAQLWPEIESLALPENEIKSIMAADCERVFKKLRELDLQRNNLSDFNEVLKLGNIYSLQSLLIMENNIEFVQLPDCDYDKNLSLFPNLWNINLYNNPIKDHATVFNELSKLAALKNLCIVSRDKLGYEEMVSDAIALIPQLKTLNKSAISKEQRRGAEYDTWKKYGVEWQKTDNNPEERKAFYKNFRAYASLIQKYGSPVEFLPQSFIRPSNLIKIRIFNQKTSEIFEKKVPRKITVQTLRGLIIKHFHLEKDMPKLSYVDSKQTNIIVELDNYSRNLDYYSVQDGDTVIVQ